MKKLFTKDSLLIHLALMIGLSLLFVLVLTYGLDLYTKHGDSVVIPDLRGKTLAEAEQILKSVGLEYEINDSTFSKTARPGTIRDVVPAPGSRVKAGRLLFIAINGLHPRNQTIPAYKDQSARQILALLRGLGFEEVEQRTVPGGYVGSVVDLKTADGKSIPQGTQLPVNTKLYLYVATAVVDTLGLDRLIEGWGRDSLADSVAVTPEPKKENTTDWW